MREKYDTLSPTSKTVLKVVLGAILAAAAQLGIALPHETSNGHVEERLASVEAKVDGLKEDMSLIKQYIIPGRHTDHRRNP